MITGHLQYVHRTQLSVKLSQTKELKESRSANYRSMIASRIPRGTNAAHGEFDAVKPYAPVLKSSAATRPK